MILSELDEQALITQLRNADESAFAFLLERYQASLVRVALMYVKDRETAEEVVQETWIAMLNGLDRFEGRSSLKTWLFSILMNKAKTRAQRENRYLPLTEYEDDQDGPTVEVERFKDNAHWSTRPNDWDNLPETQILSHETEDIIRSTIASLPPNQREVITLRDVEGWSSEEVCNVMDITETNQRVLLHRARAAVRRVLEKYFDKSE
jgi:RNA polymerase sigma-70 factor, ECF subfamily